MRRVIVTRCTVVFRLTIEEISGFSRSYYTYCCVRPAVPVGMLQPPFATLMHGFRGFGLALARSARRTGQVGSQPKSKNDTVARGTAVAISGGVCVFYQILLTLCNQSTRKNGPAGMRLRQYAITVRTKSKPPRNLPRSSTQTAAECAAECAGHSHLL